MSEECNRAAVKYVTGTVYTDETQNDEVLIPNMRFMAFSAGWDAAIKTLEAREQRIFELARESSEQLGYYQYNTFKELLQALDK